MKADNEETGDDFAKFFPMLIWAVRDHHLELTVDGDVNAHLLMVMGFRRGWVERAQPYLYIGTNGDCD